MKIINPYLILFFAALLTFIKVNAQNIQEIKLHETSVIFSVGPQPAIASEFIGISQKDITKAWEKFMKSYKAKVKSAKRETFADNALLPSVSTNTIDVYATYKEEIRKNTVTAYFAFDLGGVFVSSATHPTEYQAARQLVYDFSFKLLRDINDNKVKNANKDLKKLEAKDISLKKEKKELEQSIARKKDEIRRAELLLNKNALNQESNLKAIEQQKEFIQKVIEEGKSIK
jgi:hypothetical protein